MDEQQVFLRYGYLVLAAMAGAITALSFSRWSELSKAEIGITLFAGFSFAVFVTPWAAESLLGMDDNNVRGVAALTYILGSGSNILLPMFIRWTGKAFGNGVSSDGE